jgi:quinoprotein glucose dehydrogenase
MQSKKRLTGVSAVVAVSIGIVGAQQKAASGWTDYLGGPDSSHYSPLTQITSANVSELDVAWTFPAGDGTFSMSPLVIDNVAYVAAKGGALVALDATTGKELWTHEFGAGAANGGRVGIAGQRGMNYWESTDRKDRRILVTTGGYLYAIDAETGKMVESFGEKGRLNLSIGIDRARAPLETARRAGHLKTC